MQHLPRTTQHLLKHAGATRPILESPASVLQTCKHAPRSLQQLRLAHNKIRPVKKVLPQPPASPQVTETSPAKTYGIWAIAALFVAIGVGKQLGDSREKKIFDPPRFTPFEILDREEVSPTSIILTLRPRNIPAKKDAEIADPYKAEWEKGTWSVEFKQPELQIARRYTPLPPNEATPKSDLRFLIRKEHRGEMSGYLHTLPVGAEIGLRGPHAEYIIPENVNNVVFLAAGTGIAPALQVAYAMLERREAKGTKVHIVWANRRREDCEGGVGHVLANQTTGAKRGRIVLELDDLQRKYPGQISVDYLVDEESKFLDQKKLSQLIVPGTTAPGDNTKLILISGPDGFVNCFAGPKKWEGGKECQGPLGGILGQMKPKDWIIWKL